MKIRFSFKSSILIRMLSLTVLVLFLPTVLAGCNVGQFALPFFDRFTGGELDTNTLYLLDSAIVSASMHKIDNGEAFATFDGGKYSVSKSGITAQFDFANGTVATFEGEVEGKRPLNYTAGSFTAGKNLDTLSEEYGSHLDTLSAATSQKIYTDVDYDGNNELIFIVKGLGDPGAYGVISDQFTAPLLRPTVCLYIKLSGDTAYYQAYSINEYEGTIVHQDFKNEFLYLKDSSGNVIATKISEDFHNSELAADIKSLSIKYAKNLIDFGADDFRIRLFDLNCDDSSEAIFCYRFNDSYIVDMCAIYDRRFISIYEYDSNIDSEALLLTNASEQYAFFTYNQNVIDDYTIEYSFETFALNENFDKDNVKVNKINVNTKENVGIKVNQFFKEVSDKLSTATVCFDPYKLTGYNLMRNDYSLGLSFDNQQYVNITNVSTSKSGFVMIDDADTWLNLREGPSKDFDRVLMNPADKKSYVKQSLFSPVTILYPLNTGDNKNPIWVEIEINYMNTTLIGYSSQRYIEIPGIKKLKVGESFLIKCDTNDGELFWQSSDYSVIDVSERKGEIYAVRPGLALITVQSSSGISDSCLIMVE